MSYSMYHVYQLTRTRSSGITHRQSHRAQVHRWRIWQPEADRIFVLATQAIANPAAEGDPPRIPSGR